MKIPKKVSLEIDKFEDCYYDTALIKLSTKIDELIDYLVFLKRKEHNNVKNKNRYQKFHAQRYKE